MKTALVLRMANVPKCPGCAMMASCVMNVGRVFPIALDNAMRTRLPRSYKSCRESLFCLFQSEAAD